MEKIDRVYKRWTWKIEAKLFKMRNRRNAGVLKKLR